MNQKSFPKQLFITGTNTDIGKTVVSAILMVGLGAEYWKPIQSGLDSITDTQWMASHTNLPGAHFHGETYRLKEPLSPHASAALEGVSIDLNLFECPQTSNSPYLLVEGAGGIMVPLNEKQFMIDLIKKLELPVLLVASSELGTINHTLLSLEQLKRYEIKVFGVILNGPKNESNKDAIEKYGDVQVIAEVEPLSEISPQTLLECYKSSFIECK